MLTSEEVNQNGRRNGSYYHSVETGHGVVNENEGAVADVHHWQFHCHDVNSVGGKNGSHRGRLNKWAHWVSEAQMPRNDASEKMLAKKGSYLTNGMTNVDVRYVRLNDEKR